MKNKTPLLLLTAITLLGACQGRSKDSQEQDDSFINNNPIGEKIDYRLAITDTKDMGDYLYYSDDYFSKDASELNISFSNASLGAVEGVSPSIIGGDEDYTQKYKNGEEFIKKLGFSGVSHDVGYENEPTADSIGAIFGHKNINVNNQDYTLVFTGIRSLKYQCEWVSQFEIGESGDHAGFKKASTTLLTELKDYLQKENINGHIKLWMVGHSRGATVANLIGGQLGIDLINHVSSFGDSINYSKEDLYIQCFNPVMASVNEGHYEINGELFNNIQCFTSYDDIFSYLAPSDFNFTRFGKIYYLPNPSCDDNYMSIYNTYEKYYNNYTSLKDYYGEPQSSYINTYTYNGSSYLSPTKLDNSKINWTGHAFTKEFIDILAKKVFISRENYVNKYQNQIMKVLQYLMSNYSEEDLLKKKLLTLISEIQSRAFDSQDEAAEFTEAVTDAITTIFNENSDLLATALNSGIASLASAHRSCLIRVWFKIMDSNYLKDPVKYDLNKSFYKITIVDNDDNDFDFNLSITDQNNKEIIKFTTGTPIKLNNKFAHGLYKNDCYIYLPSDGHYSLKISHDAKNRNVKYVCEKYDIILNDFVVVADDDIALNAGVIKEIAI